MQSAKGKIFFYISDVEFVPRVLKSTMAYLHSVLSNFDCQDQAFKSFSNFLTKPFELPDLYRVLL